jgi:myo-inositol-1(or 4)-monophosphatase
MPNALDIAIELAKEAGRIQMENLGAVRSVEFKGETDIVTEIDKKCEEMIVKRLQKEFPGYDILAEEGSGVKKGSDWKWIIDPLDGTVNYKHEYPFFGPSIALEHKGEIVLGVVYQPYLDDLYVAERGGGAGLNGKKIRVSQEDNLRRSLLGTGFPYNVDEGNNIEFFGRFLKKAQAIRRAGMTAGDLCFLAGGRLEGYWALSYSPWDVAAGVLMVEEAGGRLTSRDGCELDIYRSQLVASNGLIHGAMLEVLHG